jgi:hypothetical protein
VNPSNMCLYYFVFAFESINITMQDNYTLKVMVLGNAYQPVQLVYSFLKSFQDVISSINKM